MRLIGLGAAEIRQAIGIGPAGIAELSPSVVIAVAAADIDHGVDRGRPAQNLAARPEELAVVEILLRLGVIAPVDDSGLHQPDIARRHVDEEVLVLVAGFQQQHFERRIGRQPIRQHTPGGPAADDDVVVHRTPPLRRSCRSRGR